MSASIQPNRSHWNAISDEYQAEHGPVIGAAPRLWGLFSVPDAEIAALGDVAGQRILEFGCGAGQWASTLADEGADVIGLDLSEKQLNAAQRLMRAPYALVQAAGESPPFAEGSFDVVFCDHGAMSWGDPYRTVPAVARLLRGGGRLLFNVSSPWFELCYDDDAGQVTAQLHRSYFDLCRVDHSEAASYDLPYGEWIRLFRRHGLVVEDLIEIHPPAGATSSYCTFEPSNWPERWPAESLWIARKE